MHSTMKDSKASSHNERLLRRQSPSYKKLEAEKHRNEMAVKLETQVTIDCGWGRLLLGHTFPDAESLAKELNCEKAGERDIAIYVNEPHIVLSYAPQSLFLDPSDTYRLWLNHYRQNSRSIPLIRVRRADKMSDLDAINAIYLQRKMVPIQKEIFEKNRRSKFINYLVAEATETGEILGTVMGINHLRTFNDPLKGSSLWCLAVKPSATIPKVGEALVRYLCEHFQARGCAYMDLSVMHDNDSAKKLYQKLGFSKVSTFTLKTKNAINEKLFVGGDSFEHLNPYAKIIVDEALRRGIDVKLEDGLENSFILSFGGRQVRCHESLTDLTTAYTLSLCQNKLKTHRYLAPHGINVPSFQQYMDDESALAFLREHQSIVVKPADSEQGRGISIDVKDEATLREALSNAHMVSDTILLESYHPGLDLRLVVIGYEVVAAAIRQPAYVVGNGRDSIRTLVERQSRRRSAATQGESQIPLDDETERCIREAGYEWTSTLERAKKLQVRKTANLHTGGMLIDVTAQLSHVLKAEAEKIAKILQIPVVGLDLIVSDPAYNDYVFIEANERPGLANHEPQPTAKKFIDILFPLSESEKDSTK